jgi:DNA glycosylase AlkZ-like
VGGSQAFVLVSDGRGEPRPVERDTALAELARRYLAGHGPAGERDLARWAGLPLRDARAGLSAISAAIEELGDGLVDLRDRPPAAELPPPRLLGAYEPLLLGWTSRDDVLGPNQEHVTVGGLFRPFALVRGRAVASWSMPGGQIAIEPFGRLGKAEAAALDKEAQDVRRFFTIG